MLQAVQTVYQPGSRWASPLHIMSTAQGLTGRRMPVTSLRMGKTRFCAPRMPNRPSSLCACTSLHGAAGQSKVFHPLHAHTQTRDAT